MLLHLSRKSYGVWLGFCSLIFLFLTSPVVMAAHGRVGIQGSIIDAACTIGVASRDQSIDISIIPATPVMYEGQGPTGQFAIQLVNCVMSSLQPGQQNWPKFSITFDGATTDYALFAVSGENEGVGLQIADVNGNPVVPGQSLVAGKLQPGSSHLHYTLRLVSKRQTLRVGSYAAAIRFKLDYY